MAKSKKKRQRRNVTRGVAHIQATFNNTIVTITDTAGGTLSTVTETGAEEMYQRARRYTPVRSGAVRAAWQTTPVERHGRIYEARVQNHH